MLSLVRIHLQSDHEYLMVQFLGISAIFPNPSGALQDRRIPIAQPVATQKQLQTLQKKDRPRCDSNFDELDDAQHEAEQTV